MIAFSFIYVTLHITIRVLFLLAIKEMFEHIKYFFLNFFKLKKKMYDVLFYIFFCKSKLNEFEKL